MMDIRKIRCTVPCQVEDAKSGCHCAQARDEIERLRAALRDALSYSTVGDMPVTIYENARAALEGRT